MFNFEEWHHFQGAYFTTTLLACIGALISSAEYLAISREFRSDGVFSWSVFSSRPECVNHEAIFRSIGFVFGYRGFVTLHSVRIISCVVLPIVLGNDLVTIPLMLIVIASSLILSFRDLVGNDGSDQMSLVVFGGLSIVSLSHDPLIRSAGLVFIAVQSILSYVVAGVAKLLSPKWREGVALAQIMNTRTYGLETVAHGLARLPGAANKALCWTVILVETFFFLVMFVPSPWFLLFLFWGLVFHAYNAIAMGLNTFFWSFLATYPCIVFLNHLVVAVAFQGGP